MRVFLITTLFANMAKLEHLTSEREVVKNKVARIKSFVSSFNPDSQSINQIKTRLEILNDARKEFDGIQSNIEKRIKRRTLTAT